MGINSRRKSEDIEDIDGRDVAPWNAGGGGARRGVTRVEALPAHPPLARSSGNVRLPTKLGQRGRPVATITRTSYYLRRTITRTPGPGPIAAAAGPGMPPPPRPEG